MSEDTPKRSNDTKHLYELVGGEVMLNAIGAEVTPLDYLADKVVPLVNHLGDKVTTLNPVWARMLADSEHVARIYAQAVANLDVANVPPPVDYEVLHGTIEDVRKTDPHPERLDRIEAAIDTLRTSVDARGEALAEIGEALTEIGDATAVEVSRLERALRDSETKAKRNFWLGIALAIPTGVVSSVLWWLISGRS